MQTRQARSELIAYSRDLKKRTIPVNAILHDFRIGLGHEGLAPQNPDVVSFHFEGEVYFNISQEIVAKTVVVESAGRLREV
jgi:hypothetical protein